MWGFMMKRCIHDVVYDILLSITNAGRPLKSRVCLASNLPLDRCERLLKVMEEYGLIYSRIIEGRRVYVLTERGYQYMGIYESLRDIFPLHYKPTYGLVDAK